MAHSADCTNQGPSPTPHRVEPGHASAEVDGGGDWVIMVWHPVNERIFPSTARHACAVLSFHELLLPARMQPTSAIDAMALAAR